MPVSHGSVARLYLNGFNLSPFLNKIEGGATVDTVESTVFTSPAKEYIPGLIDGTYALSGFFFGGTNELDEILNGIKQAAAKANALWLPQGDAFGNRAQMLSGDLKDYKLSSPITDAVTATADMQSSFGIDFGVVLHVLQAEGAGGNTTNLDNGALTLNGGVGYLETSAGASLVVKIQHSADNSTWADLVTFTSTSVRGSERIAVAPGTTVNRHLRTLWTGTGTFATAFARK